MEAQGLKVNTLEIAGMASVLQALRLPFGKECRSSCTFKGDVNDTDFTSTLFHTESQCFINDKDLKLLSTLVKRGEEHSKSIRGLIVYAEIEAPIWFYRELETYRVGRERLSSESTIHIDCKGLSGEELEKAKNEIPMGKVQKTIDMFSYQTLRRIWIQRHNHRLPMWHTFCEWIESLPFADSLILIGLKYGQD